MPTGPLQTEVQVFHAHLEEWRHSHLGEFVLIKGGNIVGFFPSLEQAFTEGTHRFGLAEFFVKRITPGDTVNVSLLGKHLLT
jgi:predicted acetyltransferase